MILTKAKMPEIGINVIEYLIMRYCFEQETMSSEDIRTMMKGFLDWKQYAEWTENTDLLFILSHQAKIIKMADEGKYKARKGLFMQHYPKTWRKVWRKSLNVPGARTAEDIYKAEQLYEKYKKDNPEQEA